MKTEITEVENLELLKLIATNERKHAISLLNKSIENDQIDKIEESFRTFLLYHKKWLLMDDAMKMYKIQTTRK